MGPWLLALGTLMKPLSCVLARMKSMHRSTLRPCGPRPGVLPPDMKAMPASAQMATLRLYPPERNEPSSSWRVASEFNPRSMARAAAGVISSTADFSGSFGSASADRARQPSEIPPAATRPRKPRRLTTPALEQRIAASLHYDFASACPPAYFELCSWANRL